MSEIREFRGIMYNYEKLGELNNIITPPYDVLTPKQVEEYKKKSDYNIVHLIKNKNYEDVAQRVTKMLIRIF